jgi:HPt (histidine-containing phosphotransfer) domain-containing protein
VALTAHAIKGSREQYLSAGMDDYVTKPVRRKDLADAIERILRKFGRLGSPAPCYDHQHLIDDLGGDVLMFRRMVTLFSETTPGLITKLRQAGEAQDLEAVARTAHKLRGSALQFNAQTASELAGHVEEAARAQQQERLAQLVPQLQVAFVQLEHELRQASERN